MIKKCNKCNIEKELSSTFYYRNKSHASGYESICKVCVKERVESKKSPIIYMITNLVNGNVYIGQTVKPLKSRISHHFSTSKRGSTTNLHTDMRLYKRDNFSCVILEHLEYDEDLDKCEEKWISHYSKISTMYNELSGGRGSGFKAYDSFKEKISNANSGKKLSKEHIGKIAESKKKNGTYGRSYSMSEDGRRRVSEANKNHKNSTGSKNSMSKITEEIARKIILDLIDKNKIKDISKKYNVSVGLISSINNRKSWSFIKVNGYEDVQVYHKTRKSRLKV